MLKDTKLKLIGTLSANGVLSTNGINVKDYKNLMVQVMTTGSATLTFKFQMGVKSDETPPTFSSAASYTNPWSFVESYDNNNTSSNIVGSTGVTLTGTDIVANYVVNTNNAYWFDIQVSGYSAGTITAYIVSTNNA